MAPRGRDDFVAMVEHGLKVAGAKTKVLSDQAMELLWRVSNGLPRHASRLLRTSLILAHERGQNFVDERVMLDACEELQLGRPTVSRETAAPTESRGKRETKSRKWRGMVQHMLGENLELAFSFPGRIKVGY